MTQIAPRTGARRALHAARTVASPLTLLLSLTALALLLFGCECGGERAPDAGPPSPPGEETTAETAGEGPAETNTPGRARLVVAVVLDQLGYATLERYLPSLDEGGALRRIATEGVYQRVAFQHAATYTAAGHASIFTGASPRVHGVMSNRVYHPERGEIPSCDDGSCPVFGHDGRFASPSVLRAPTVGDALREARPGARLVSLSFKDRGSVIPAGQRPDAVVFWDTTAARFTTSSFYGEAPPAWLDAFMDAHPFEERLQVWQVEDPLEYAHMLGPDARPGEGGMGFGASFPHDPRAAGDERPASAFLATPASADYLLELARAAAEAYALGEDETPDLLTVSISTTDYVGHSFGHGSWEYLDNLRRVDRALRRFLDELEAERGPIAVLVTSDHGHADVAQAIEGGGRVDDAALVRSLEGALDRALGGASDEGEWVQSYTEPFVYLTEAARAAGPTAMEAALAHLAAQPGVARVYDVAAIDGLEGSEDPVERLVYESVGPGAPGQIFVVLAPGWMVDNDEVGAGHGTPWDYDREVPALFMGPGVTPRRGEEAVDQRRVGATIAALLGVDGPGEAPAPPIEGAPTRAPR